MVRRTHHLLLWIFALFVGYLLLVRGVITWAQFAPNQVDSVVEFLTDSQIQFQKLEIDQSWLGVTLNVEGLLVEHPTVEFEVGQLAVDLNLFSPLIPNARWGEFLELKQFILWHLNVPASEGVETAGEQPATLNSEALEAWIGRFNLNRLWTRVDIADFSVASFQDGIPWSVDIANFQAFKGSSWSLATDIDISYGDALHHEQFMLKGSFSPNVWGRAEQGQLAVTSFQPLKVQRLANLLPQKWHEVLPNGELMLDLRAHLAQARLADMQLELYAQALHWPDHNPVLPKTLGINLVWENQEQVRDLSRINWRFSASHIQMDSRYIETVAPIELSLSQNRKLHFATDRFDIEPFKPMLHAILKNEKVAELFQASVALSLHSIEGDLDVQTLFLDNLSLEIAKLAVPVTDLPGLAMEQVYLDKRGSEFQVIVDKPFWVMEPRLHPIPMRFQLQKRLSGEFDQLHRLWQLDEVVLDWDKMPVVIQAQGDFVGGLKANLKIEPDTVANVKAYLPYSLMSSKLQDWLKTALVSGKSVKGELTFDGNLNDFPFIDKSQSQLSAVATVNNMQLKFQPDWPALPDFDARIEFTPYQLTIIPERFNLAKGLQADKVAVHIDDLHSKNIAVRFAGQVQGEANDAVAYLQQTPLLQKMGIAEFLQDKQRFELQGPVKVSLDEVWIPVYGFDQKPETVKGSVALNNVQLRLYDALSFDALNGTVAFSEASVEGKEVKGHFEGGPFTMKVTTANTDGNVLLDLKGRANAAYENWVTGQIPWQSQVRIPFHKKNSTGRVSVGLDVDGSQAQWHLPAPFDQAAMATLSHHEFNFGDSSMELSGHVAKLGVYKFKLLEEAGLPYRLVGVAKLGGNDTRAVITDENKLIIQGNVPFWDMDGWINWQGIGFREGRAKLWQPINWGGSTLNIARIKLLSHDYPAAQLHWQSTSQHTVSVGANADYLQGVAEIRGDERIDVQLNRLRLLLPDAQAEETDGGKSKTCDVQESSPSMRWPTIHFSGQNMSVGQIALSKLAFQTAEKRETFLVQNIDAELGGNAGKVTGTYFFHRNIAQSSTEINLKSKDVGRLTQLLGLKKGFEGKGGTVKANLTWEGGVSCFHTTSLIGKTVFTIEDGVIESIEPGFARMLGLLNVTSLARRLSLNIKDVTTKGLVYDSINGTAYLKDGLLHLDAFKLKAPSVSVGLTGNVNLEEKQFALKADVTPALGSSLTALSAITGIASPFTALAVYALMKVIPDINEDLISYYYDVTGPWDAPVVKERRN